MSKRTLAILLIAIIGIGSGVGLLYLYLGGWIFQDGNKYSGWTSWRVPGVSGIYEWQWIKIGMMGDIGDIRGDANYQGGYLAAKELNEAGGVIVNGTPYYVAIAGEDTDECATDIVIPRPITPQKMVYELKCQYGVGGYRTEFLLAYREPFMANKIPFLGTGAMSDIFCENVGSDYSRYKYFWRVSPYNSSWSSTVFTTSIKGMYQSLLNKYGSDDIDHMGILAEDLTWTTGIRSIIPDLINTEFGGGTVTNDSVIAFAPDADSSSMNGHLQTLEDEGCDLVLIAISLDAGLVMAQQWAQYEHKFLLFGSNFQAQTAGYWDETDGACEYEIGTSYTVRCNKTEFTIPFWDAYYEMWDEDPLYMAIGAYDAVNLIVDSINKTQSFDPDVFVADMETYTPANPKHGCVGGDPLAWDDNHDIFAGYPFSYDIWFQWQNGTKVLIPSFTDPEQYPNTLSPIEELKIPPWFDWDEL
ncbi:MAG: hypothetical protein ACFFCE_04245 [Promethearchaeota archaeon]